MPIAEKGSTARGARLERRSRVRLGMPVTGMEAEFNVILDGQEIDPRAFWGHPMGFIEGALLPREKSSFHLPTGGAVYFDRGVIEVVTPVIELAPGCTARVVRNLWECIGFVRAELTKWEAGVSRHVRLKAYSTHYNVSFELPAREQARDRNVKSLALLLAYILPMPVALLAANRRSTGVGVRPRGNRIEITCDFTPDPGLMIATATFIVGVVREVMSWPSYRLDVLDELPIPTVAGIVPGKHTTRKGWLTKDYQYAQSPFACDVDERLWDVRDGRRLSLRAMAGEVAWYFRRSIRRTSDPFSFRLLFAVLAGRLRSLLELDDRPAAYEDVGRLCRWGMVLPELRRPDLPGAVQPIDLARFLWERQQEGERYRTARGTPAAGRRPGKPAKSAAGVASSAGAPASAETPSPPPASPAVSPERPGRRPRAAAAPRRETRRPSARGAGGVQPAARVGAIRWHAVTADEYVERRGAALPAAEKRRAQRRRRAQPTPFPDRRLTRSAYEKVFLKLVSGGRLRIGRQTWTPIGMKGWYQAIFRRDSDGRERLLTIDDLLQRMNDWE